MCFGDFRYLRYGHVSIPIDMVLDLKAEADYYQIDMDFSGVEQYIDSSPMIVSEVNYPHSIMVNAKELSNEERREWKRKGKELNALNYTHCLVRDYSFRITGAHTSTYFTHHKGHDTGYTKVKQSYFLEKDVPDKITIPLNHAQ